MSGKVNRTPVRLTPPIRLTVRERGDTVYATVVVDGHEEEAVQLVAINAVSANLPGMREAFLDFCRVLVKAVVEDSLGRGSVSGVEIVEPRKPS